jgi:hypothetical protein
MAINPSAHKETEKHPNQSKIIQIIQPGFGFGFRFGFRFLFLLQVFHQFPGVWVHKVVRVLRATTSAKPDSAVKMPTLKAPCVQQ